MADLGLEHRSSSPKATTVCPGWLTPPVLCQEAVVTAPLAVAVYRGVGMWGVGVENFPVVERQGVRREMQEEVPVCWGPCSSNYTPVEG